MIMQCYCQLEHVTDLILSEVTKAAEELNPQVVERTIKAVSGEISDLLSERYDLPFQKIPEIIRWISTAITAFRVVGGVTSLMDSEGGTNNQWLPLQDQYKRAWSLLLEISSGQIKLGVAEKSKNKGEDQMLVLSPDKYFNLKGF